MIVGGSQTTVGEYPYYGKFIQEGNRDNKSEHGMISKLVYFSPVDMDGCGASLIAPGVVLSAAHCAPDGFSYVGKTVIVGGFDRQQVSNGAVSATVTETLMHPSWSPWAGMSYDFM